ncbi:LysR substrate-binding domain-containing protein [Burkholderia vietnamiensis]|uniref:LysR substrate-binding domain-containing protein n=1 Tax=Burkholderia vietnamiensis TaxID=60552 RepID=UPI0024458C78|nr:LysR substrate-binding domain-containing protein [Burkholderia vietnamiensis]
MTPSHRHIEIFRLLMQSGSATQTARILSTSQSTISRELAIFERSLGFKLFERTGGRLVPTRKSAVIYAEVERSYQGLDRLLETVNQLRESPAGVLKITAGQSFSQSLLASIYRRFRQRHNAATILVDERQIDLIDDWQSVESADVVFVTDIKPPLSSRFEQVLRSEAVCVAPDGHPILAQARVPLRELARWPLVQADQRSHGMDLLRSAFRRDGLAWKPIAQAASVNTLLSFVRHGIGITVIDPLSASAAGPGLSLRPVDAVLPFDLALRRSASRYASVLVDDFVDYVYETVEIVARDLGARGVDMRVYNPGM